MNSWVRESGRIRLPVRGGGACGLLVDGQVAVEGEALAVEAGGHQAKQQRRRADHWHHLDAGLVGAADEQGARDRRRRAAGFDINPKGPGRPDRGQQCVEIRGPGFREFADVEIAQRLGMLETLEFGAGGLGVLDDKIIEAAARAPTFGRRCEGEGASPRLTGIR